jgi:hypothetical protein
MLTYIVQVGQLQEQHCAHVNVAVLGGYFVEKFTLRHSAAGDSVNAPPKALYADDIC